MVSMKTMMAAVLLSLAAAGSNIYAADSAAAEQQEAREINVRVAITGHESGRIYKVKDESGQMLRADLGKHGGRMLNNHAFLLTAEVLQDEKGELLYLKHVDYQDPEVLIAKKTAQAQEITESAVEAGDERDVAYGHVLSSSDDKSFYQYNVAKVTDLSIYKNIAVSDISKEEAGAKVAFSASALATVKKDEIMRFWGGAGRGGFVEVEMNGAYVPLGQRSTVYGTVLPDNRVSLERLDSVE